MGSGRRNLPFASVPRPMLQLFALPAPSVERATTFTLATGLPSSSTTVPARFPFFVSGPKGSTRALDRACVADSATGSGSRRAPLVDGGPPGDDDGEDGGD